MLAVLLPSSSVQAETQGRLLSASGDVTWAKGIGGTGFDSGASIAVDKNGNNYLTGSFSNTVDFDPGPGTTNLTSAGGRDIFVAKYDSAGNLIWAKGIGGTGLDFGTAVVVDASNNVYVTGLFTNTVDFDPGAGIFNLSASSNDIFLLKLDSHGGFLWAKKMGGPLTDQGIDLKLDPGGNILVLTDFESTADFDPGPGIFNLTSKGFYDVAVVKLDATGSFIWAKGFGGTGEEYAMKLAIDQTGNIFIIGSFENTVDFDPDTGISNLTSNGLSDIFLSVLDSDGQFTWSIGIGGSGVDEAWDMSLNAAGNIYLTGNFSNTVDFDPGAGEHELVSEGDWDIFILNLTSGGGFNWAKSIGGTGTDWASNIAMDSLQNVYLTGGYMDTVDFDPDAGILNLTSAGQSDVFIAQFNNNGQLQWAKSAGGTLSDYSSGLVINSDQDAIVTGSFSGIADFDSGAGNLGLTSAGEMDIFIAKYTGEKSTFADVPFNHSAWQYIEAIYNAGITGGCTTTPLNYCPNSTVTRAQMAIFLLRGIHGSSYTPPAVGDGTGFNDVPTTHSAAAWIKQLAAEGITGGCGNGNYCPNQAVTRAQMAIFLLRAKYGDDYVPPAVGDSSGFNDVPAASSTAPWIKQLAAEGITGGCGGGNYCPNNPVTRAQMAIFLQRTFNLPLP
ncbi:MAG: S-layer homology domain-containing protein [Anaerolineales bacterium]|nr:MAG: S-layer homology domain-containing protein [Anaerolineales bacterium]